MGQRARSRDFLNRRDKSISAARDGDDVRRTLGVIAERLANRRDMPCEVVFLDEGIRPDELDELVLLDDPIPPANQVDQDFKGLRGKSDECAVAIEDASDRVGDKRTKRIDLVVCAGTRTCHGHSDSYYWWFPRMIVRTMRSRKAFGRKDLERTIRNGKSSGRSRRQSFPGCRREAD